jgi:hypothetical protein
MVTTLFDRWYAPTLRKRLARPYVHLLFGARQTGKSTLLKALLPAETLCIDLADPMQRTRLLAHPGEFAGICRALPPRPLHGIAGAVSVPLSAFLSAVCN